MFCPVCEKQIGEDEVLMLTHDNQIIHSMWDTWDQVWIDLHNSAPDQFKVTIHKNSTT